MVIERMSMGHVILIWTSVVVNLTWDLPITDSLKSIALKAKITPGIFIFFQSLGLFQMELMGVNVVWECG